MLHIAVRLSYAIANDQLQTHHTSNLQDLRRPIPAAVSEHLLPSPCTQGSWGPALNATNIVKPMRPSCLRTPREPRHRAQLLPSIEPPGPAS
eukprot:scaffold1850_cov194-Pinguiococcus_pyrenoidosus.AAC.53